MSEIVAGGLESPPLATLVFSVAAAFLSLVIDGSEPSMRKTGIRILPVALLAILTVLYDKPIPLAIALLLGAVGDALLVQGHVRAFIGGLGAFLGERAILAVLFLLADQPLLARADPWRIVMLAAIVVAIGLVTPRAWPYTGPLKWPFAVYALVLVFFAGTAALVPPPLVLVGVILMIYSDMSLACERFLRPTEEKTPAWISRTTWLARYAGQAVIAFVAVGLM